MKKITVGHPDCFDTLFAEGTPFATNKDKVFASRTNLKERIAQSQSLIESQKDAVKHWLLAEKLSSQNIDGMAVDLVTMPNDQCVLLQVSYKVVNENHPLFELNLFYAFEGGQLEFHSPHLATWSDIDANTIDIDKGDIKETYPIDCEVVPLQAMVAGAMLCNTFWKACQELSEARRTKLADAIYTYIHAEYALNQRKEILDDINSKLSKLLLAPLYEHHELVVASDVLSLWNAPLGTELHFLRCIARADGFCGLEPHIKFQFQPATIRVVDHGYGKMLEYCKKHGVCNVVESHRARYQDELIQGTFESGEFPCFGMALLVDSTEGFELLRQKFHKVCI